PRLRTDRRSCPSLAYSPGCCTHGVSWADGLGGWYLIYNRCSLPCYPVVVKFNKNWYNLV
ncbi:MAG: hypothetical protein WBW48_07595, partial [Anaerolineae bacterium]